MKTENLKLAFNPFSKIAGLRALGWGIGGILLSSFMSYFSGYHYHGLLHFGPAPNPAWWCFLSEHFIIWLIPALLFYIGGLILSRSQIRLIDVFGTIAFAQLPLLIMNLFYFLPPMQKMLSLNTAVPPLELVAQPWFMVSIILSVVSSLFLIWALVWMFNALRVSCNLKGYKLGILYCIGVFGGDFICRYLIGLMY